MKNLWNLSETEYVKPIFLTWAGLRHSVPSHLNSDVSENSITTISCLTINGSTFDVGENKSKDYYNLLIRNKAQLPFTMNTLQSQFNLSSDILKHIFMLPHSVALESYVKAFQCYILSFILYTNSKLYNIGFIVNDLCSFCMV